jgi:DNA-binding transcriptional MocR family regulator
MVAWLSTKTIVISILSFFSKNLDIHITTPDTTDTATTTSTSMNNTTIMQQQVEREEKKQDSMPVGVAARLARKNILELQPYRCARDDYSEGILLDANENAFGPTSLPTKNLDPFDNSNSLERYPDPYQFPLKELLAKYRGHGLTPANIFVGVGSDEAIDLLMRIFCAPGKDQILITPPTYGMYKVCAKVNDVEIISVPLTPAFDVRIPEVCFSQFFLII